MLKRFFILLLCTCLFVPAAMAQQAPATLTVQGTAAVTAQPDLCKISANASVIGETAAAAQEEISTRIAAVTDALLALGLSRDDIVTLGYNFYPSYSYEGPEPVLHGYAATHTIEITCHDVTMLDSVLSAITGAGVSEVYSISYDVSNRSELYRQALCDALAAATEKAKLLAVSAGLNLNALECVTEQYGERDLTVNAARANGSAKDEAAGLATGIRSGTIWVTASVEATFSAE